MIKILLILWTLSAIDWQGRIFDKAELLTSKEVNALNSRLKRIQNEAKIEFLVLTSRGLGSGNDQEQLEIDDYQILIQVFHDTNTIKITAGEDVLEQIPQSQLERFAVTATDHITANKKVYGSIDWCVNNITYIWLTDYYNDAKADRTAHIALLIFIAFFILFLFRFSKAFDPYIKSRLKKWRERQEQESIFGSKGPFG